MSELGTQYSAVFVNITASAAQDFFYIKPAADKPVILTSCYVTNVAGTTEAGDAKEEFWRVEIIRLPATVTVGSAGNSVTPTPTGRPSAVAAGCAARINDTTVATTSGTALTLHSDGMNSRVPFQWNPQPHERLFVGNAQAIVVRLNSTPARGVALNGTLNFIELG